MEEGLEERGRLLPSNAEPAVVVQPGDGAFDGPSSLVATQRPTVLGLVLGESIRPMRRDELDAPFGERLVEGVAVVGLVTDDPLGQRIGNHEVEELLGEVTLDSMGGGRVDRGREPVSIDKYHDLHAFTDAREADAIAPTLRLGEGAVDEALVESVAVALFDEASCRAENALENTVLHPPLEPPVHGALAAEPSRKILPLGPVVEHPEDASDDLALVGARPSAERALRSVGNLLTDPVEDFGRHLEHDVANQQSSCRFRDSF